MTVKLKTPSNGSVSLTPQDTAADVVLTVPSGTGSQLAVADSSGYTYSGGLVVSPQTGFKNRIINGDMRIDQRNNGASVTVGTSAPFSCDRWQTFGSQNSKFTAQQNAGGVTPPPGHSSYLGCVSSSAYTPTGSEIFLLLQKIEGFNVSDLDFGKSSAQSVVLSFWVRSSLTGTFGGSLQNAANNRCYPFSYSVNAANTWEQKTIAVPGDTTGTWLTNNSNGLQLNFSLGAGPSASATAGSWTASTVFSATGATSVVGTNGATFYITGVQLEKGTVATPFEFRSIGQELVLCQRYYEKSWDIGVAPGTGTFPAGFVVGSGVQGSTTSTGFLEAYAPFQTSKRAAPTIVLYDHTSASGVVSRLNVNVSNNSGQGGNATRVGTASFVVQSSSGLAANSVGFSFTASAEL